MNLKANLPNYHCYWQSVSLTTVQY